MIDIVRKNGDKINLEGISKAIGVPVFEISALKNSGIEEGDLIVEIDNKQISTAEELVECVNSSNGEALEITYLRDGNEYCTNIEPIETSKNEYKLGLWVRDGAAGVGTITYYEPSTGKFAALGHGIIDIDTQKLINISSGELVTSKISSIVKGKEGIPRRNKGKHYWTEKQ